MSILDLEKLVDKGLYRRSTLVKYQPTEKHLIDYLSWRAKGCDVLLQDLRMEFASNFVYYLQAEKGLSINSSGEMIKLFLPGEYPVAVLLCGILYNCTLMRWTTYDLGSLNFQEQPYQQI